MTPKRGPKPTAQWFLEGSLGRGRTWRVPIETLPFTIGRHEDASLTISSKEVSRHHARIYEVDGALRMIDLGSTNGSFVNRQPLRNSQNDVQLHAGDIIHFGMLEFRFVVAGEDAERAPEPDNDTDLTCFVDDREPPPLFLSCAGDFRSMLRLGAVSARFQPIVRLSDGALFGHELLGRGAFEGLPESPLELFNIAEHLGLEVALSQLFRRVGVAESRRLKNRGMLFINMHPSEIELSGLLAALQELRDQEPSAPFTLEVHEKTVTDTALMKRLQAALKDMQIKLAYDDFGAGQARMVELVQTPPDFLKFDIGLIRDIHVQPPRGRQFVKTLVDIAKELGIVTLAEGVSVAEEAQVCAELGFEFAQGYHYAHPFKLSEP